eukprot:SAG11_NODE_3820_length_2209_cov_1.796209_2_plen_100_part_00
MHLNCDRLAHWWRDKKKCGALIPACLDCIEQQQQQPSPSPEMELRRGRSLFSAGHAALELFAFFDDEMLALRQADGIESQQLVLIMICAHAARLCTHNR